MLGCFVTNLLNNKTIILLNLAEYRLILGLGLVSDDIERFHMTSQISREI